jgi:hypothetical protein
MTNQHQPRGRGSALTARLHQAFLSPLGGALENGSEIGHKPLLVDLGYPHPPRLRVYLYSLVHGVGERSRREYKVVLRVPGQPADQYGSFDHSGDRFTVLAGYDGDLDVFVLWDAALHLRFKNGGNLQVRDEVVRTAAAIGVAEQVRRLGNGNRELVLACQSHTLAEALAARVASTGGLGEGECAGFLTSR